MGWFPIHKSLRMRVKIGETETAASGARWSEGNAAARRPMSWGEPAAVEAFRQQTGARWAADGQADPGEAAAGNGAPRDIPASPPG